MKIGIDARFLTHPQVGGFKTYTVNLIRALSQIDHENRYVIYLDREPADPATLPQAKNVDYRVVRALAPLAGMAVREQVLLPRHIARDHPDVVHFLCNTAPVRAPAKSILTLHDVIQVTSPRGFPTSGNVESYRQWAMTAYSRWAILKTVHAVNKVITPSCYEKHEIVKRCGVPSERICVTYFGVDSVFAQATPQERQMLRARVRQMQGVSHRFIMGVGYEPRKNMPLLLEAFSQVAPRHSDLGLVIVAAGKERRAFLRKLASESAFGNRIVFLNALQPHELAELYNVAAAFVFPSERESFGLPPLEAIACGVPTIASNTTSLPEVLGDGAVLVDGKNVQAWVNAIETVLGDERVRKDLIARGLRHAAKFTWQQCAEKTLEIYRAVAAGGVEARIRDGEGGTGRAGSDVLRREPPHADG